LDDYSIKEKRQVSKEFNVSKSILNHRRIEELICEIRGRYNTQKLPVSCVINKNQGKIIIEE